MSSACVAAGGDDRVVAADAFQVVGILLGHRRHVIDHQNLRHDVRSRTAGWNIDDDARAPCQARYRRRSCREGPSPVVERWRAPDPCRPPSSYRSRRRSVRASSAGIPRPVSATVTWMAGRSPSRSTTCVETVMRPGFDCRLSTALAIRFSRIRRNATGSPTTRGSVRSGRSRTRHARAPARARTTSVISAFRSQSRRSSGGDSRW